MLCDIRGLPNVTYCTLTCQSSGNWGRHAKQHASFTNFEPLELYWTYFLALQTTTPKIPLIRLMSLDHEPKMRCCAISSNYGPWWDYIAMSFGPWASASFLWIWTFLGFKIDSPKIHNSVDVVRVANEMKSCGVKKLSSTRVRDCKTIIIYRISLSFPLPLLLQLPILKRFLTQTHTSPNLSVVGCFAACGKHLEKVIDWWMQFGANCRIRITSEDIAWWNPLGAGTQKVQVHWVD